MRTKMRLNRLEHATATAENVDKTEERKENLASYGISKETRKTIDAHKTNFQHSDEYFSARKLGTESGRIYTAILLEK